MDDWLIVCSRCWLHFCRVVIICSLCGFVLQGITNTVGAVPGIVGVALTGYLLDSTHSWSVCHQSITHKLHYISWRWTTLITISGTVLCADITLRAICLLLLNWYCSMVSICQQWAPGFFEVRIKVVTYGSPVHRRGYFRGKFHL